MSDKPRAMFWRAGEQVRRSSSLYGRCCRCRRTITYVSSGGLSGIAGLYKSASSDDLCSLGSCGHSSFSRTRKTYAMKLLAILVFLGTGLRAVSAAEASIQSTGRTLTLGGISYFVPPSPVSALRDTLALAVVKKSSGQLIPFSVIPTSKTVFDQNALQATIDTWIEKDDVWSESFLAGASS